MSSHDRMQRLDYLLERGMGDRAIRNVMWLEEHCLIPDGKYAGKPLVVADFMLDDFAAIYRDPDDPRGPVRKAIISRPRKQAKTMQAAMIFLLALMGPEARPATEMYSGAMSRDQASVLYKLLTNMIRMNPELLSHCIIRDTAKEIVVPALGSKYKALSKDGKTAHGLSPRLVVLDEMGQEKRESNELIEALVTGSAAQDDPLFIIISTQAPTDAAFLSKEIDAAMSGEDESVVLRMNSLPLDHPDPFSIEAMKIANPAWDVWINQEYMIAQARDAARTPSKQAYFRNLFLNQRVDQEEPFIERALWNACAGDPLPLDECDVIYGGLDLSETRDLTALVLVGVCKQGLYHVHPYFWLPNDTLKQRAQEDAQPYDRWNREGLLLDTPGKSVSYDYVAEFMYELFGQFGDKLHKLAFDRHLMKHFTPALLRAGFDKSFVDGDDAVMLEFGQGFVSMSPAVRVLEGLILDEKIRHGAHPVLTMNMAFTRLARDPAGNRKPAKHKSLGRIDGMVCLTMAAGAAEEYMDKPKQVTRSYLEDDDLLVL